ncbi:MAG: hypothetical protein Q7K03_06245 [Dehalococcoidia bacterium]|nr:hypothetical protein [Dehalococcoidia bacterium]
MKNFSLDPDNVTGKARTITFVLQNEGRCTHDLRVEWQIPLPPGTYRILCPVSNHADRGTNGALKVVS